MVKYFVRERKTKILIDSRLNNDFKLKNTFEKFSTYINFIFFKAPKITVVI